MRLSLKYVLATLLAGFACDKASAQLPAEWSYSPTLRASSNTIPVCLYHPVRTPRDWAAKLGDDGSGPCELLTFSLDQRVWAPAISGFAPQVQNGGMVDGDCSNPPSPGVSVCTSEFFTHQGGPSGRFVTLNVSKVDAALAGAGFLDIIRAARSAQIANKSEAGRTTYRAEFNAALSAPAIQAFKRKYAFSDPEQLIPKLDTRLAEGEKAALAAASTSSSLTAFISNFEDNDVAKLIPEARSKLAKTIVEEKALADLERSERLIANCKHRIAFLTEALIRAEATGNLNGYVMAIPVRMMPYEISVCRSALPKAYVDYKRLGGTKRYDDIK